MLKFEGIKIGTKIKAFHFQPMEGRPDSYITGTIIGIRKNDTEAHSYEVKVDTDVIGGKSVPVADGKTMWVPFEVAFMEFDNRITVLVQPNVRSEFLDWSREFGGYGNEEDAFTAGWNAAMRKA